MQEDEDMDIEVDVKLDNVGGLIKNEQLDELEEDELDEEPLPPPRVARRWPDVDTDKRNSYERRVDSIRDNYDDVVDVYDTTMVNEYSEDIFNYMSQLEVCCLFNSS